MKMYILVKETIPIGFALVAVVHASLAAYLKFQGSEEVTTWLSGPFYKTICKVTDAEFEKAKEIADHVIITESGLGGQEVALAFKPREEWPKSFRFYRLYK
jgi:peptidyl-tRNA hydrolase